MKHEATIHSQDPGLATSVMETLLLPALLLGHKIEAAALGPNTCKPVW